MDMCSKMFRTGFQKENWVEILNTSADLAPCLESINSCPESIVAGFIECMYVSSNVCMFHRMYVRFIECMYVSSNVYTFHRMYVCFIECMYVSSKVCMFHRMYVCFIESMYVSSNV